MAIDPLNPAPRLAPISDSNGKITYEWDRFFQNTYSTVNAVASSSLNANLLINNNFNSQASISGDVTESSPNGSFSSDLWQVNSG